MVSPPRRLAASLTRLLGTRTPRRRSRAFLRTLPWVSHPSAWRPSRPTYRTRRRDGVVCCSSEGKANTSRRRRELPGVGGRWRLGFRGRLRAAAAQQLALAAARRAHRVGNGLLALRVHERDHLLVELLQGLGAVVPGKQDLGLLRGVGEEDGRHARDGDHLRLDEVAPNGHEAGQLANEQLRQVLQLLLDGQVLGLVPRQALLVNRLLGRQCRRFLLLQALDLALVVAKVGGQELLALQVHLCCDDALLLAAEAVGHVAQQVHRLREVLVAQEARALRELLVAQFRGGLREARERRHEALQAGHLGPNSSLEPLDHLGRLLQGAVKAFQLRLELVLLLIALGVLPEQALLGSSHARLHPLLHVDLLQVLSRRRSGAVPPTCLSCPRSIWLKETVISPKNQLGGTAHRLARVRALVHHGAGEIGAARTRWRRRRAFLLLSCRTVLLRKKILR
eukprot:scaffold94_cov254-Pinguiococcus_pyrenoidosus.AAC.16